ncbi:MAG: tRNA 2-thiouridine(34) synthase MnmA [Deltaproteobacteria bacterium]|nr:tRNA 2-thiouridine(34) synthase MnmA [Deltaproteobacteria bacterium]
MTVLSKKQVVVAMSGGVDSSVAALILKEQGLEVIGISMKTHDTPESDTRSNTCCTASDINDARRVCQLLDIPFYPLNFKEQFQEKVIDYFKEEYGKGRTPNPCVACNSELKFSALLQEARKLGAYYLATGHYAQKVRDRGGKHHLMRAKDRAKDQTYFLFELGQEQLEHTLFPIGKYTKEEVREFARAAGLKTADKPESQEICFVPNNDHVEFLENSLPAHPGNFVDQEGKVLGENRGIHAYTVGQRRGLGVSAGERMYVTDIIPEENKVVLGKKEDLLKQGVIANKVHWIHREAVASGMDVEVKLRHRHPGAPAVLWLINDETIRVEFKQPEGAITPGQAAVIYNQDEVLGGGWIEKGI